MRSSASHMTMYGVLTCVTHLLGLAYEEIGPAELAFEDPRFPVVVTVRAVKQ